MANAGTGALSGAASGAVAGSQILPGWGTAIGGVIGGLAGLAGGQSADDAADAAKREREQQYAAYANIPLPTAADLAYHLGNENYVGDTQVAPLVTQQLGPSAYEQISVDPRLQASQNAALAQYTQLANGQMSDADKAAFQMAQRTAAGQAQAKQGQILQEMQQRGQGGSGAELIARLQGAQSSTDQLQAAQLQQAQAMQQARLQALSQQAGLSSQMENQQYGQQANLAQARQAINNFNAQNAQQVANNLWGAQNQANQINQSMRQGVNLNNTNINNTQAERQANIPQIQFGNQMSRAGGVSGALGGQAAANQQQAANTAGGTAGLISGAAGLIGAAGKAGLFESEDPED